MPRSSSAYGLTPNNNVVVESTNFSDGTLQGWYYYYTPNVTVDNGRLKKVATQAYNGVQRLVNMVAGKTYRVKYENK